ncbi:restriction endonuclease subunit S [Enterococcus faecium]|uniref:restriction endonuclease subunit S n=1 Tax=Enterococcus faecium TaxID=1352 RepID=UPI00201994F8|nr:restriction endonuclease subunit S [Enterococcus faecium]UQQ89573.1 restriction endonuclease subunit S [Enterococcus faecium]
MSNDTRPEIRFPGFTEDWEERKLSEMANFSKGNGYSKADLAEEGHPVILYGRLYTKYETIIENVDTFAELKEKSVISNGGEVIVPASGETPEDISRASVVDVSGVALGGDLNIIKTKSELDPIFLALTISNGSQQKEMTKRAQGKSVVHLHNSDLKEVNLLYPKLDEQVKIGSFFKKLDVSIALHQRKLDLLKETKKGFLQKMFPKNGAKVPEIRFPGFTEDWEQRKLGDLGSVAMNKRIFKDQTSDNGEVPFFKIGTFGSHPDAFISRELFEEYKSKYPYPEVGDILISASGSIGRTVVYQGEDEYFQDSNIVWLKHNGRLDNKFLQQFYSIVKWQGLEGSTIKRLYNKNILDTNISVPTLDEQNKLGAFFEQLDDTIALQQRKLDLLKETKKGFLQKMFV